MTVCISNSYATGDVSAAGDGGGLVGQVESDGSSISNSYATGNVSADGDGGGLVGEMGGDSSIYHQQLF